MGKLYPVIPTKFRGLSYFSSKDKIFEYFKKQDWDKESIEKAIEEGTIHIGLPPDMDLTTLMIDKEEGRYYEKFYERFYK